MMPQKNQAILLIGPTGVGKTPLGDQCQLEGIGGRACRHFDFGSNLRQAALSGFSDPFLNASDVAVIRSVLSTGALLENETFHIAEKIFEAFIEKHRIDPETLIVLNGLPRHVDQAEAMARRVEIRALVVLESTPENVSKRIRRNTGGDRSGRTDDNPDEIAAKLDIYHRRTRPLIGHYASRNIPRITLSVDVHTTATDLLSRIAI